MSVRGSTSPSTARSPEPPPDRGERERFSVAGGLASLWIAGVRSRISPGFGVRGADTERMHGGTVLAHNTGLPGIERRAVNMVLAGC